MSAKDQKEIIRIIHELENGDAEQVSAALEGQVFRSVIQIPKVPVNGAELAQIRIK